MGVNKDICTCLYICRKILINGMIMEIGISQFASLWLRHDVSNDDLVTHSLKVLFDTVFYYLRMCQNWETWNSRLTLDIRQLLCYRFVWQIKTTWASLRTFCSMTRCTYSVLTSLLIYMHFRTRLSHWREHYFYRAEIPLHHITN